MADQGPTGPLPFAEIIQYGGMAIGAALAALLVRLGWKKPPAKETEVAIAGQATIVDVSPIKELLKQVDLLTLQLQKATVAVDAQNELHARSAAALEKVAVQMGDYIAAQLRRQEADDLRAEVAREVERLRDEEDRHRQPPPSGRVSK